MMTTTEVYSRLCWHDPRSPYYIAPDADEEPIEPRVGCSCDACFYGRDPLAVEILQLQAQLDEARAVLRSMVDWLRDPDCCSDDPDDVATRAARLLDGGDGEARIRALEAEGMSRSDAQAVYDAEQLKRGKA